LKVRRKRKPKEASQQEEDEVRRNSRTKDGPASERAIGPYCIAEADHVIELIAFTVRLNKGLPVSLASL
jgi:hypothetical protein